MHHTVTLRPSRRLNPSAPRWRIWLRRWWCGARCRKCCKLPPMDNLVKICGLSTPETLDAALSAGADMVGFVRFAKSPRHVSLNQGHKLSLQAKGRAQRVVLLVNPGDEDIAQAVEAINPDLIQLHGSESPARVAEI